VLGQFALTYLRKRGEVYLESLAEDSTSDDRAEWLVNGQWVPFSQLPSNATLKHWRLRGINAVLLFAAATGAKEGKLFDVKAPLKPFSVMADAGDSCADLDDHIRLDQSVYWYQWNPDHAGCRAALQDLKVTISKMLPKSRSSVYPEFDKLTADKKVTAVILFGQIGDDLSESDAGFANLRQMAGWPSSPRRPGRRWDAASRS
jgi:hypothetical protein